MSVSILTLRLSSMELTALNHVYGRWSEKNEGSLELFLYKEVFRQKATEYPADGIEV